MARGIKTDWECLGGVGNSSYVDLASISVDMTTTNLVLTCWAKIKGPTTTGIRGQIPMHVFNGSDVGAMFFTNSTTSPFTMQANVWNGGETQLGSWSVATDEDWFYVAMWDKDLAQWTFYAARDEAVDVGTAEQSPTSAATSTLTQLRLAGVSFNFNWGCNIEVTNFIASTPATLPDEAALFAQMNSDAVTLASPYAHLDLLVHTDLEDLVGAHDGTIVETVTTGTMDPVDLQAAASADFQRGLQNLETFNLSGRLQE